MDLFLGYYVPNGCIGTRKI